MGGTRQTKQELQTEVDRLTEEVKILERRVKWAQVAAHRARAETASAQRDARLDHEALTQRIAELEGIAEDGASG